MLRMVTACALLVAPMLAGAEERYPVFGTLYPLDDQTSMDYECLPQNDGKLQCDFIQTSVVRSPGLATTQKMSEEMRRRLAAGEDPLGEPGECETAAEMRAKLSNPELKAEIDRMRKDMREAAQADLDAFVDASGALCDSPTAETLERFIQVIENNDRQVCQIRTHRFTQTFAETSPGNWVNTAAPEGACGVVRLDRFQIDRDANMGSMTMWNYTSQKTLTTPDGDNPIGLPCSEMDQNAYRYTWRERSLVVDCKYIKFGLF
jgi:hypothetical protein